MDAKGSYTEGHNISIDGDTLIAGGKRYPLNEITKVRLSFHIPMAAWRLYAFALIIFLGTATLLFCVGTFSIFSNVQGAGIMGAMFVAGMVLCFGLSILATFVHPLEWRVELDLMEASSTVYVSASRTHAQIFADRVRRVLSKKRD